MINITPTAQLKIAEVLEKEETPDSKLRIFVEGGGCSGFQYGFIIEKEKAEDDWEIPTFSTTVLIDPISMQYLENITLDFKSDLEGERFAIYNPSAKSTCGCGSSFNPY